MYEDEELAAAIDILKETGHLIGPSAVSDLGGTVILIDEAFMFRDEIIAYAQEEDETHPDPS